MNKNEMIDNILEKEWDFFSNLNNIGGRASCQDNKEDFIIMRKAQWLTFNNETLFSYLKDLDSNYNPLFVKYAEMMRYNFPQEYEKIKSYLKNISKEKEELVKRIMEIYMKWEEEFFEKFPIFSSMGRPLYSQYDDDEDTSIETYLKGELLSYSENTLNSYFNYISEAKNNKINLAIENMDNLAKLQGFNDCNDVEEYYRDK